MSHLFSFFVSKLRGFKAKAPVVIFDDLGREFYKKESSRNFDGNIHFNLPIGHYYTADNLEPSEACNYNLPRLAKPEKNIQIPENIRVIVKDNPNKASIYLKEGRIILDPSMLEKTKPELTQILFHEIGHYFYSDESKCDLFAIRNMLLRGFNPSQCGKAILSNLTKRNFHRQYVCVQTLVKADE